MNKIKNQNSSINICKLVAAILVVYIHTEPLATNSQLLNVFILSFSRIAVPFFYFISAYFLADKINNKKYIFNYIKKLLIVYLFWLGLRFILILTNTKNLEYTIDKTVFFFIRGNYQFWYIRDLIFLTLLYFLINFLKLNKLFNIICLTFTTILVLLIFINKFYNSNFISLMFPKNDFFTWRSLFDIPCFYLGILIFKNKTILLKLNNKFLFTCVILSSILFISVILNTILIDKNYTNLFFDDFVFPSSLLLLFFLIILLLKDNKQKNHKQNKMSILLKNTSTFIYYSHMLIYFSIFNSYIENSVLCFVITILICFILSYLFLKLNNKKVFYITC